MARAKKEKPIAEIESKATEETEQSEETIEIKDTVLLENIYTLRFIDKDGRLYRLDDYIAGGVYWLKPA